MAILRLPPSVGFGGTCPTGETCKIVLGDSGTLEDNHFDANSQYYLVKGTLVFKDKGTGEYLFDLTGDANDNNERVAIQKPYIENNLEISPIDDIVFIRIKPLKAGFQYQSNVYYTNSANVEFPADGYLTIGLIDTVTINGRLHTTDVDGKFRTFNYSVNAGTRLEISSNSKVAIVASY